MLLEGEPGIGKTALLAALRDRGEAILHARASPLEREFPFAVVRQLFESRLVAASEGEREALLGGPARLAAPLFEQGAAPADTEYALLQGLHWLCANVAGERALLVAVDDVQWADAPSLRFVHYLLGRLEELPVLVALARCTGEPAAESELLAAIAASPVAQVLRPQALSAAAVAELIAHEQELGPAVADAEACHEATGGNPFLLRALLAEIAARSAAGPIADIAPPAIASDQLQRLERCSPHAVALAQAVAVLDPAAQLRHAAALADLDEASATQAAGAKRRRQRDAGRPPILRGLERADRERRRDRHARRALRHERVLPRARIRVDRAGRGVRTPAPPWRDARRELDPRSGLALGRARALTSRIGSPRCAGSRFPPPTTRAPSGCSVPMSCPWPCRPPAGG